MQVYCVGGAVRDELLGRAVKDHDYVVVGKYLRVDGKNLYFSPVRH